MAETVLVAPEGRSWVIRHNDGVIGHVRGRDEAQRLAQQLVDWMEDQGRSVELKVADDLI